MKEWQEAEGEGERTWGKDDKRKRGWGRRGREWSAVLITDCDGLLKSVIHSMSSLAKLGIPT